MLPLIYWSNKYAINKYMTKKIWGKPLFGRWPKSKKEEQEFGAGKNKITVCPQCDAIYYYKSWHHDFLDYKGTNLDKEVIFKLCPADQMKKDGFFEGEVIIDNFPNEQGEEILNIIENTGEKARKQDILDRILNIEKLNNKIIVTTSENQLAQKIGKNINKAKKGSKLEESFSEEDVIRVRVYWQ